MKTLPLALTYPANSPSTEYPGRVCVITRMDGTVKRIAELDEPVTISGNTFSPVAGLAISAVQHTIGGQLGSMQITGLHADGGVFDTGDLDTGRYDSASVHLYVINRANPTTLGLMFTGDIGQISFGDDGTLTFDIQGHSARAAGAYVPTRSPMCRTDLFSRLCRLDAADFALSATIDTIIDRFNFTVTIGSPQADGWFAQGTCLTDEGVAFELAKWVQSTAQLTAYLPCSRLISVGMGLTLYPGCDFTTGAGGCGKFSNWLNFQGEPHSLGYKAAASGAG